MISPFTAHQERLMCTAALLTYNMATAAIQRHEELQPFSIVYSKVMQDILNLFDELDQQRILDDTKAKFKLAEMVLTGLLEITQRPTL